MGHQNPSSPRTRQHRELKLEIYEQVRAEIWKMRSTLDLGPLLWTICQGLGNLGLRFDVFGINLIEVQTSPPSGTFHFRTPAGGWGQYQYPSLAGSSLLAIWEAQHLVYRRDLQAEDPYGERPGLDNPSTRCIVDVPFVHGTLALSSTVPDAFAASDLELLQEMAALCSEGFGRLDDLKALERRAQEAEVLSAAIAVVAAASGLEEVFRVVVREAARLTSAERVVLFLYDETEKALVPRAQVGMRWEVYQKIRLQPGEDVSGQVLLSGEGLLYDNLSPAHQTLRPENRTLLEASIQTSGGTGAVVPLKVRDRVVGTLSVCSQQHHCTQRDLVLLERLAAQAALAIERARHDRELSLNLALQRVRSQILGMGAQADWHQVVTGVRAELENLVDLHECSVQLVINRHTGHFVSYNEAGVEGPLEWPPSLEQVVTSGQPLYRRRRAEIEQYGDIIGAQINSIVDVPFAGGTLAMNSLAENAFSLPDIQILQSFAQVMSEAYQRLRQLQRQEAVRRVREAVWQMQKSEDLLQVLTVIRQQLIEVGIVFDDVGLNVVEQCSADPLVRHCNYLRAEGGGKWVSWTGKSPAGRHLIYRFWQEGKVVYRPDLQAEDSFQEGAYFLPHIRCVVDVPFSHGTLAVNSKVPNAFAADDIELLEELAVVLSEGFKRLDDLQQLEQRAREAEALAEGISAMVKSESLDQVLQTVVEGAARLTGSRRARIFLYNANEKVLVPRAQIGHRWEIYRELRVAPGEGLAGLVLATGTPQLMNAPPIPPFGAQNQELYERSLLEKLGPELERVMGVPLVCGGQVAGVLSVNGSHRRFTDHDLGLLVRLGEQAALAIERARHARELSLNLALQRVRNETLRMEKEEDWTRVRVAFHEELTGLVDCCRCSIQLVDRGRRRFVSYGSRRKPDASGKPDPSPTELRAGLRQVVESGAPLYRRTRAEIESWGEVEIGPQINSVVDVPFAGGTLAMNSLAENAFSDQDIQVLQSFAQVMSEAHLRLKELQRQEVVRQVREAVWGMGQPADLERVLTVIREQLIANQFLFDDVGVGVVEERSVGAFVRHYNYLRAEDGGKWVSWTDEPTTELHPIHQIWQEGKVAYRRDLQAEDPFRETRYFSPRVRCVVDVPFSHGTLALNSQAPNAFADDDIELLKELAVVLSEGFKRLDDLQQLEQRAQEAEALASAINAVYSYADLDQRLQEIVRQVKELIGAQRCLLLLYDEGTGMLVPHAREGYGEEAMQLRIGPEEGLSGHVYSTGRSYFNQSLPDPQLQPLSPRNQALLELAFEGSAMGPSAGIPLKLRGQTIGAVVAGQVGRVLGERDLLLLERLVAQASLAIERSQHERELALNLALQRVRNEILEMKEAADWEKVLSSLHSELGSLVEFWFCSIQFIDQLAGQFTYYTTHFAPEDWHLQGREQLPLTLSLKLVLTSGHPLYRRTRAEVEYFQDEVGPEVQCIVDVPFLGGTVAINSIRENAFSDQDIAILERFAQVISEGYRRLQDLKDLALAQQRLQQVQKLEAVGQLTAGIAHNFNNLLQANLGNINLAMLNSSAEVQGYLQDADAAAMRGADLVRQLMLFARAEVRETPFKTVDLGAVIANTVSLCRKTIDRRIELQVEIPAELPLIQADAGQLEQVLLNLYLNARDALVEAERLDPWIRTMARVVGEGEARDYVCVEVSDNGAGMDEQTRERIFEPFFTTKEMGKGTGLGLATAYGILQRHQGWIECQSQVGQGTTFSLYLPAGVEPGGELTSSGAPPGLARGTETLLIVDDEELVRRSTARLFADLGYRVLEAEDGLRGLGLFAQHRGAIDLVVLDLSMPGLSGREVLRQLKVQAPRLKVIVFTGYAAVPGEFAGLAQVVEKPFSLRRLAEVVRRVLDAG